MNSQIIVILTVALLSLAAARPATDQDPPTPNNMYFSLYATLTDANNKNGSDTAHVLTQLTPPMPIPVQDCSPATIGAQWPQTFQAITFVIGWSIAGPAGGPISINGPLLNGPPDKSVGQLMCDELGQDTPAGVPQQIHIWGGNKCTEASSGKVDYDKTTPAGLAFEQRLVCEGGVYTKQPEPVTGGIVLDDGGPNPDQF